MIVHTGSSGIAQLQASLYFVAEMVVITSATRTITLDRVASIYCLGGTMMGVMYLISIVFTAFVPSPDAVSRQFVVPILEEFGETRACRLHPLATACLAHRGPWERATLC